jgi:hypothetical protein
MADGLGVMLMVMGKNEGKVMGGLSTGGVTAVVPYIRFYPIISAKNPTYTTLDNLCTNPQPLLLPTKTKIHSLHYCGFVSLFTFVRSNGFSRFFTTRKRLKPLLQATGIC